MDEVETIKHLLGDWGWEYSLKADRAKVIALCRRLGMTNLSLSLEI